MANWVLFAAGATADRTELSRDTNAAQAAPLAPDARLTSFTVEACRPVVGPMPAIVAGPLLRIESAVPVELAGIAPSHQFRGTAQHLNYTSAPQRADLEARSRAPFPDPSGVLCVLIPIAKSAAWWQLTPDERTASFQRHQQHHQHARIGSPYVERIYRKLYHSRYHGGPEAPIPYDFVTYFEFKEADRAAFEDLLAGLHDTKLNPEWAYVEHEFEIWMRRSL